MVNTDEILEEFQQIAEDMINTKDSDSPSKHGLHETGTEALNAIANYVQVHVVGHPTVSAHGLETLLKIARSDSSASKQAQNVLFDLLAKSKNSLSPLIQPVYFEMCTFQLWPLVLLRLYLS